LHFGRGKVRGGPVYQAESPAGETTAI
jgi:hypothetical protein